MNKIQLPIITTPPEIAIAIESLCSGFNSLEKLEELSRVDALESLSLISSGMWVNFCAAVREAYAAQDFVIIKGLPVTNNGATLLIAAYTIGTTFRTYRGGQIIKHFKMSPWTKELSHTIREGEFHSDLNTEEYPPAITAMQCLDPDPGAPEYGLSRIARLEDLLSYLEQNIEQNNTKEALHFLTRNTVTMLNDRSSSSWSGRAVDKGLIRYHPDTLRAAARRFGDSEISLDERIAEVSKAALAVSEPFVLERGDVLLLSNHRTLHYRGECSVIFKKYPTDFIARSIFILHASRERSSS